MAVRRGMRVWSGVGSSFTYRLATIPSGNPGTPQFMHLPTTLMHFTKNCGRKGRTCYKPRKTIRMGCETLASLILTAINSRSAWNPRQIVDGSTPRLPSAAGSAAGPVSTCPEIAHYIQSFPEWGCLGSGAFPKKLNATCKMQRMRRPNQFHSL